MKLSQQNKYYTYSTENLEYKEVYKNTWQKYIKNYPLFLSGFFACIIIFRVLSIFIQTPNEKRLLKEKDQLKSEFEFLRGKLDDTEKKINSLSLKDDSLYRTILGIKPLPKTMKDAGKGGARRKQLNNLNPDDRQMLSSMQDKVEQLSSKTNVLDYSLNEVYKEVLNNKEKLNHVPAIMPIHNKDLQRTGSGFGMRFHPILKIKRMHEGIDFYAMKGTEVYATADGVVESSRYSTTFGNVIVISHGYNIETLYAHLSKFNVKVGQKVKRGQVIAFVGSTGLSSGPHLHYEVHLDNKEVNPVHYFYGDLTAKEYDKIIELSEREVYSMD